MTFLRGHMANNFDEYRDNAAISQFLGHRLEEFDRDELLALIWWMSIDKSRATADLLGQLEFTRSLVRAASRRDAPPT